MSAFTKLELAALHSIFSETPELAPALEQQLNSASVTERVNTGGGFYTTISVSDHTRSATELPFLGMETNARLPSLKHGLGFNLFLESGRLDCLEGFLWGPESTEDLDLFTPAFEVFRGSPDIG